MDWGFFCLVSGAGELFEVSKGEPLRTPEAVLVGPCTVLLTCNLFSYNHFPLGQLPYRTALDARQKPKYGVIFSKSVFSPSSHVKNFVYWVET